LHHGSGRCAFVRRLPSGGLKTFERHETEVPGPNAGAYVAVAILKRITSPV